MPAPMWSAQMPHPWEARGTAPRLMKIIMRHEVEHREVIAEASA
jgi:hypothetical protein